MPHNFEDLGGNLKDNHNLDVHHLLNVCKSPDIEIKQKKEKKQQKGKDPEEKSTLQRSKTFVNLLFKGGRKRDTSRGRSKSPSASDTRGVGYFFASSKEFFTEGLKKFCR